MLIKRRGNRHKHLEISSACLQNATFFVSLQKKPRCYPVDKRHYVSLENWKYTKFQRCYFITENDYLYFVFSKFSKQGSVGIVAKGLLFPNSIKKKGPRPPVFRKCLQTEEISSKRCVFLLWMVIFTNNLIIISYDKCLKNQVMLRLKRDIGRLKTLQHERKLQESVFIQSLGWRRLAHVVIVTNNYVTVRVCNRLAMLQNSSRNTGKWLSTRQSYWSLIYCWMVSSSHFSPECKLLALFTTTSIIFNCCATYTLLYFSNDQKNDFKFT